MPSKQVYIDTWRVVTERPPEGEVIELDVQWYGEAKDARREGK